MGLFYQGISPGQWVSKPERTEKGLCWPSQVKDDESSCSWMNRSKVLEKQLRSSGLKWFEENLFKIFKLLSQLSRQFGTRNSFTNCEDFFLDLLGFTWICLSFLRQVVVDVFLTCEGSIFGMFPALDCVLYYSIVFLVKHGEAKFRKSDDPVCGHWDGDQISQHIEWQWNHPHFRNGVGGCYAEWHIWLSTGSTARCLRVSTCP